MKLSGTLLQAIALSVTVAVVSASCHKNDVNAATTAKEKKERPGKTRPDNCPACGMG